MYHPIRCVCVSLSSPLLSVADYLSSDSASVRDRQATVPTLVVHAFATEQGHQRSVRPRSVLSCNGHLRASVLTRCTSLTGRLDAVEEIMNHPSFEDTFRKICKGQSDSTVRRFGPWLIYPSSPYLYRPARSGATRFAHPRQVYQDL